ncbi:MAG: hypothetical protein JW751_02255 [Polyangiaceae bacterium]|nr:hypothetical protein [Polyangiaceae bacterium]
MIAAVRPRGGEWRARRPSRPRGLTAAVVLACSVGCRGAEPPAATAPAPPAAPAEYAPYAPLADGNVLSYVTESDQSSERGLVVLQVRRPHSGLVELDDGGHVERLYLEPDGLRYAAGGHWLKLPLQVGACWAGRAGEVCITSIDDTVEVPAGSFSGCLSTIEAASGGGPETRTRTVFCRDVGMVLLEVERRSDGEVVRERALLRYYGPRIVLDVPSG